MQDPRVAKNIDKTTCQAAVVMRDTVLPIVSIALRGKELAIDRLAWKVARNATWRSLRTYPDSTLATAILVAKYNPQGVYCRLLKRT